jgi:aspartyl-tRNA(Asn)/glutamyl-tRNA(Gln) amidotransferase subunit A
MKNDGNLTIQSLAPLIRKKKLSPVELTRFLLERIAQFQPAINAYITVTAEIALAQARQAEKEIVKGKYRGVLHGIPISLKDLFYTRDIRTTGGSRILSKFIPKENAIVVDRLMRAGCVLLGKTNMHEFAYGPTNLNPHYGAVHNPWNTSRISGGSSGGSAASVVAAQAIASLGTDTGGSIRIPSAACGCVGLKPAYGHAPTTGVIPLSFSLDHVGPLSRCVADAAFMFQAIVEPTACQDPGRIFSKIRKGIQSFRIGMPKQYFFNQIQPDVRRAVLAAADVFRQLGVCICDVDLQGMEETGTLAAEITGAEALAYHSQWLKLRPQDYGEDVRARLEPNNAITAIAYIQALQKAQAYSKRLARVLESVTLLLAPTIPIDAPGIEQKEILIGKSREDVRSALLRLTRPGNLSGLPAISIPCGFSSAGLPIGMQLIGRRSGEIDLLRAAYAYEQATPWHREFPEEPGTSSCKKHPQHLPAS